MNQIEIAKLEESVNDEKVQRVKKPKIFIKAASSASVVLASLSTGNKAISLGPLTVPNSGIKKVTL